MQYPKGTQGHVNCPATVLHGKRCEVRSQSRGTGILTVAMLEDAGAYRQGDTVHLPPYEFKTDAGEQR